MGSIHWQAYGAVVMARYRTLLQYRAAAFAGIVTQLFWGAIRLMVLVCSHHRTTHSPNYPPLLADDHLCNVDAASNGSSTVGSSTTPRLDGRNWFFVFPDPGLTAGLRHDRVDACRPGLVD